jgi:hypothetical protein
MSLEWKRFFEGLIGLTDGLSDDWKNEGGRISSYRGKGWLDKCSFTE